MEGRVPFIITTTKKILRDKHNKKYGACKGKNVNHPKGHNRKLE